MASASRGAIEMARSIDHRRAVLSLGSCVLNDERIARFRTPEQRRKLMLQLTLYGTRRLRGLNHA